MWREERFQSNSCSVLIKTEMFLIGSPLERGSVTNTKSLLSPVSSLLPLLLFAWMSISHSVGCLVSVLFWREKETSLPFCPFLPHFPLSSSSLHLEMRCSRLNVTQHIRYDTFASAWKMAVAVFFSSFSTIIPHLFWLLSNNTSHPPNKNTSTVLFFFVT